MEVKSSALGPWDHARPPAPLADRSAILVHGSDPGGITELCLSLVAADRRATLDDGKITAGRLREHLDTGLLFGGGTHLLVRNATDRHADAFSEILRDGIPEDSRLVVQAGSLGARSRLRSVFVKDASAAAVALYPLRGREISTFARDFLDAHGFGISRDALALAERLLGTDRAIAARRLEVAILHAQGSGRKVVDAPDLVAVGQEAHDQGLHAPIDGALDGRLDAALRALDHRLHEGVSPIALLRAFSRRLQHFLGIAWDSRPRRQAIQSARPPVFWAEKALFERILSRTDARQLEKVLIMLDDAERRMISTGIDPAIILGDLLCRIARKDLTCTIP